MNCRHSTIAGLLLLAFTSAASAAGADAATDQINFLDVLSKGGPMMYPLMLLSIVAVLMILIYLLTIRRNTVVSDHFMNVAESLIRKRDFLGLVAYSRRQNESIARITQKTMDFITNSQEVGFESVREVAQTEGSRQAGILTSRITYLADIGAIAPMVGLLGTVIGMIKAFFEISHGKVEGVRQMGLAEGVSEALIATALGLCISIIALGFYSYFRGRVHKRIGELEAAATHLVGLLQSQFTRQQSTSGYQAAPPRFREDYTMPVPSPLSADRPDLHGI